MMQEYFNADEFFKNYKQDKHTNTETCKNWSSLKENIKKKKQGEKIDPYTGKEVKKVEAYEPIIIKRQRIYEKVFEVNYPMNNRYYAYILKEATQKKIIDILSID